MHVKTARALVPLVAGAALALGAAPAFASVVVNSLALTEGAAFDGTVAAVISRCDLGSLAPQVAWGDGATSAGQAVATGQSTFAIHAAHTYAEEGTYGVAVTVKDCSSGGSESGRASAHVADAPLTAAGMTLSATAGAPFSGAVAAFADADPGATPGDYTASIDWGDGRTTAGAVVDPPGAGLQVHGSGTYASAGSYTVSVRIADAGGATTVATSSIAVAAAPRAPSPPPPAHGLAVMGAERGHSPVVRVYDALTGELRSRFLAYRVGFRSGVRVAAADIDGDGRADIVTGPGPGVRMRVKVFSGAGGRLVRSFPGSRRGVYVAAGDVDGDRRADVIVGAGAGADPRVRIFDGATGQLRSSFLAYGPSFHGGVRVAAADVNADGHADVIAGSGPGAAAHVKVFDGAGGATLMSFLAYTPSFSGGVYVAGGDVDGDGRADVIAGSGPGVAPHVKVFSGAGAAALSSFLPFGPAAIGGTRVAATDADGDGRVDVVAVSGQNVKVFGGPGPGTLSSFLTGR